jgi:hypothetical protein
MRQPWSSVSRASAVPDGALRSKGLPELAGSGICQVNADRPEKGEMGGLTLSVSAPSPQMPSSRFHFLDRRTTVDTNRIQEPF